MSKRKRTDETEIYFNDSALLFLGRDSEDHKRAKRLIGPLTQVPHVMPDTEAKRARLLSIESKNNNDGTYTAKVTFDYFPKDDIAFLENVPILEERKYIENIFDETETVDARKCRVFSLVVRCEKEQQ